MNLIWILILKIKNKKCWNLVKFHILKKNITMLKNIQMKFIQALLNI